MDDSSTGPHARHQTTGHDPPATPGVHTGPAGPLEEVYTFVYEVMRDAERVLAIATTNRPPHILRADLVRMRTCTDEALFHLTLTQVHLAVEGGTIRGVHRTHQGALRTLADHIRRACWQTHARRLALPPQPPTDDQTTVDMYHQATGQDTAAYVQPVRLDP